jgi:hypothetical protein
VGASYEMNVWGLQERIELDRAGCLVCWSIEVMITMAPIP